MLHLLRERGRDSVRFTVYNGKKKKTVPKQNGPSMNQKVPNIQFQLKQKRIYSN